MPIWNRKRELEAVKARLAAAEREVARLRGEPAERCKAALWREVQAAENAKVDLQAFALRHNFAFSFVSRCWDELQEEIVKGGWA